MSTAGIHLPTVAIVGRPNVGKSSLFNAVVGRRLAIVHEMSGVTRDRVAATVSKNARRFTLIDTGGLGTLSGESRKTDHWDAVITTQVEAAVSAADILIFVGDAQAGPTPLDADIASRLRASGKPVICAVNKCDDQTLRDQAAEFLQFGFDNVYPIDCLRRGGLAALLAEVTRRLPAGELVISPPPRAKIAVIGRPNVGKSSLINALLGTERVATSPIAGTTRDAIDIELILRGAGKTCPVVLVDTAGLRKTAKVDNVVELFSVMRAKSAIERADLVLMVVEADAAGMTAQDRKIAGLIQKAGKACVIAANKCDLCPEIPARELAGELRRTLPGLGFAPVEFISAREQSNLEALCREIVCVIERLERDIPTGALNRMLAEAFERTPPPVRGAAAFKMYYASMTGKNPHRFKLFVNRPEAAQPHYLTYLKNQLRAAFDLSGVAIELTLCARPKKVESIRRPTAGGAEHRKSNKRSARS